MLQPLPADDHGHSASLSLRREYRRVRHSRRSVQPNRRLLVWSREAPRSAVLRRQGQAPHPRGRLQGLQAGGAGPAPSKVGHLLLEYGLLAALASPDAPQARAVEEPADRQPAAARGGTPRALRGAASEETAGRHGVARGSLIMHSNRGAPMTSKPLSATLAELGLPAPGGWCRVNSTQASPWPRRCGITWASFVLANAITPRAPGPPGGGPDAPARTAHPITRYDPRPMEYPGAARS